MTAQEGGQSPVAIVRKAALPLVLVFAIFTLNAFGYSPSESSQAAAASISHVTLGTTYSDATVAAGAHLRDSTACGMGGWCVDILADSFDYQYLKQDTLISKTGMECPSNIHLAGPALQIIGFNASGKMPDIATVYCEPGTHGAVRMALSIFDPNTQTVIATTLSPDNPAITASYTDYPKDPSGNAYPFLAPSQGDTIDPSTGAPIWGYLCLYKPGATQTGQCGPNFMEIPTTPKGSFFQPSNNPYYFREVGGYLSDLDNDGWDDISLIYESLIYTISGQTGKPLATTVFNAASGPHASYPSQKQAQEDTAASTPAWFHSGRNYTLDTVVAPGDGTIDTVMIAGAPVGAFTDAYCGVSRFVGLLSAKIGAPASQKLAWSRYYGFAENSYAGGDTYVPTKTAAAQLVRPADIEDGCIHRFSDGLSTMGGTPVVIFDYFSQSQPISQCVDEQYSYYAPANNGQEWLSCLDSNLEARGSWNMQVLRLSDGQPLTGSTQTYIWGMSNKLLPSGEEAYLVENVPATEKFNMSDVPTPTLAVETLTSSGSWQFQGILPIAGVPALSQPSIQGSHGQGEITVEADLTVRADPDNASINDVELSDGTWIGYDTSSKTFVVKGRSSTVFITPVPPTASPSGGTYTAAQTITLSGPANANIFYSTNGSAPRCTGSTAYTSPIQITTSTTLNAIACNGTQSSSIVSLVYTINQAPTPRAVPPVPTTLASSCGGDGTVTFSWTESDPSVIVYNFNLSSSAGASSVGVPNTRDGSVSYKTPAPLTPLVAYQWDVSAINAVGTSQLTPIQSFTCRAPASVGTTPDQQRMSDLQNLQSALAAYLKANAQYPNHNSWMPISQVTELTRYIASLPKEPNFSCSYLYASIPSKNPTDYKVLDWCSDINYTAQPSLIDPARSGGATSCPGVPSGYLSWSVYSPGGKCIW